MSQDKSDKSVSTQNSVLYHPPKDLAENSNVMQWMKKKGFETEAQMRAWTAPELRRLLG